MKEYTCSLDSMAKYGGPGLILAIILLTLVTTLFVSTTTTDNKVIYIQFITPIILIILFIAMYLLKTLSVSVADDSITINRKIKPVVIEFSEIASIRRVDDMKFAMRTFGNGGLFGYTGMYYKKGIGSMTWYCTQRQNYILIEKTGGKKLVVTPDDADGFMQEIAAKHAYLITTDQQSA